MKKLSRKNMDNKTLKKLEEKTFDLTPEQERLVARVVNTQIKGSRGENIDVTMALDDKDEIVQGEIDMKFESTEVIDNMRQYFRHEHYTFDDKETGLNILKMFGVEIPL